MNKKIFTDALTLQLPKFDSLFNDDPDRRTDAFAKSQALPNLKSSYSSGEQLDSDISPPDEEPHSLLGGNRISGSRFSSSFLGSNSSSALSNLARTGHSENKSLGEESASQKLMRGFGAPGFFPAPGLERQQQWDEMAQLEASQQRRNIEDFQQRVWQLTTANSDLLKQLSDRDKQLKQLQTKYTSLESQHTATTGQLSMVRAELEQLRRRTGDQEPGAGDEAKADANNGDVILSLKMQLDMEQLRSRSRARETRPRRTPTTGTS